MTSFLILLTYSTLGFAAIFMVLTGDEEGFENFITHSYLVGLGEFSTDDYD